jgi:peptidoglycan hydrolase-like protein with peptidoglycan-binding domain
MSGQRSKDEVKKIQEALKSKGHDPGMADGIMGPKTQQAMRAFQKKNNIEVTGRLDDKTASALGVESSAAGAGASQGSDMEKAGSAGKSSSGAGSGASKSGAGASSSSGADKAGSAGKAGAAGQTPESRPGAMPGEKKAGQQ